MLKRALFAAAAIILPSIAGIAFAAQSDVSPAEDPHFVTLPALVVPVVDGATITGRLSVDVVVDAADAEAAAKLAVAMPRLRSASIAAGLEFSRLHVSGLTPVDVELLSRDLTVALHRAEPGIGRVLIVRVAAAAG